jgi:hypothetical protein
VHGQVSLAAAHGLIGLHGDDQAADGSYAIRISLADVKGMSEAEMERIVDAFAPESV